MSFVSVLATTEYISVVSDGRAMNNEKIVDENVQKFTLFGDKFIAYAGVQNIAELLVKGIKTMENVQAIPLQIIGLLLQAVLASVPESSNHNLLIAFGGKNEKGEIELYSITSKEPVIVTHIPRPRELSKLFLTGNTVNCDIKFFELLGKYGFSSSEAALQVQNELNDFVADHDLTVNKNKTHLIIER